MPNVDLKPETFARCQKMAVPLVDTIDDVVSRALDALEKGFPNSKAQSISDWVKKYDGAAPPALKHATPRKAQIEGVHKTQDLHWNSILADVIEASAKQGASPHEIIAALETPSVKGQSTGPGYRFVKGANVSFQQLNSDRAWGGIYRLAKKFGVPVMVRWAWANKSDAHLPGGIGFFEI